MAPAQRLPVYLSSSTQTNGTEKVPTMVRQARTRDSQRTLDLSRPGHEKTHIERRFEALSNGPNATGRIKDQGSAYEYQHNTRVLRI